jgi:hypothetical protein
MHVNGVPERYCLLKDGDQIQVGRHVISVRYEAQPNTEPMLSSAMTQTRPTTETSHVGLPSPSHTTLMLSMLMPSEMRENTPALRDAVEQSSGMGLLSGPPLTELVHQFRSMQHQMFDQFQQTLLTMLQGFGHLYRDQFGAIHQELNEIRRLTSELQSLQAQGIESAALPSAQLPSPMLRDEAANPALPGSSSPPQAGTESSFPTQASEQADASRLARGERTAPGAPTPEVHDLLSQRIAALHVEQQGRWQKILGLLKGERSAPGAQV